MMFFYQYSKHAKQKLKLIIYTILKKIPRPYLVQNFFDSPKCIGGNELIRTKRRPMALPIFSIVYGSHILGHQIILTRQVWECYVAAMDSRSTPKVQHITQRSSDRFGTNTRRSNKNHARNGQNY